MSRLLLQLHRVKDECYNIDNLQVQWDLSGYYPSIFDVCNNLIQITIWLA